MRALLMGLLGLATVTNASETDIWRQLHGDWRGSGEVNQRPAELSLSFRPAFGGRGHHLQFANRMQTAPEQTWTFAAEALYLCTEPTRCRGHWYDNRGMVLPLSVQVEAHALRVEWGDASTERGRTVYRIDDGGALLIEDEVLSKEGAWRTFGRGRLERVAGSK